MERWFRPRWLTRIQVLVVNSFSKYYGMTGWRLGWLVAPEDYIDAVEKLAQNLFWRHPPQHGMRHWRPSPRRRQRFSRRAGEFPGPARFPAAGAARVGLPHPRNPGRRSISTPTAADSPTTAMVSPCDCWRKPALPSRRVSTSATIYRIGTSASPTPTPSRNWPREWKG